MRPQHKRGGLPWWKAMTPLTQSEEDFVKLPPLLAFKKLEAGDATVKDYNTLITQFMLGKKLAKHFERSAEVREFIDEAWHELNKCRYGGIKEDQLNTIHECVVMCGTMIEKCEKFRVMQALEEIRK